MDLNELRCAAEPFLEQVRAKVAEAAAEGESARAAELTGYPLRVPGHMLRPFLVFLTSACIGGGGRERENRLAALAAAVELLHTASLVHDDLLDHDRFRRGRKCIHEVYGFRNALLCGNLLYIKAIRLCSAALGPAQVEDLLETAASMCEGELLQNEYAGRNVPESAYFRIIGGKTSSLLSLSCRQAAVLCGAAPDTAALFGKLGAKLGLLYQLLDDCRDGDVTPEAGFDSGAAIRACGDAIRTDLRSFPSSFQTEGFLALEVYLEGSRAVSGA